MTHMKLVPNQNFEKLTQRRYNKDLKAIEYLAYGGGNESWHTTNLSYFKQCSCKDTVFGKPCLVLISVCWMNVWARVECVPIPDGESQIDVYIHHLYEDNFYMHQVKTVI
jgi:hypothetical protein